MLSLPLPIRRVTLTDLKDAEGGKFIYEELPKLQEIMDVEVDDNIITANDSEIGQNPFVAVFTDHGNAGALTVDPMKMGSELHHIVIETVVRYGFVAFFLFGTEDDLLAVFVFCEFNQFGDRGELRDFVIRERFIFHVFLPSRLFLFRKVLPHLTYLQLCMEF